MSLCVYVAYGISVKPKSSALYINLHKLKKYICMYDKKNGEWKDEIEVQKVYESESANHAS